MKTFFILAAVVSTALAFGPFTVPLITKTTTPPIDCDGVASPYTLDFCEYKPQRLFRHPHYPKWFISCGGITGNIGGQCQRCGPHAVLELNEECQMCLRPGEKCPKALPKPVEIPCEDDGCPFCPEHKPHGGFTAHRFYHLYCQCVWGKPKCMPCPCQQYFDPVKKCCVVNKKLGIACPKHE